MPIVNQSPSAAYSADRENVLLGGVPQITKRWTRARSCDHSPSPHQRHPRSSFDKWQTSVIVNCRWSSSLASWRLFDGIIWETSRRGGRWMLRLLSVSFLLQAELDCIRSKWEKYWGVDGFPNTPWVLGGVLTLTHKSFYREWIGKSFPMDREGLTVFKSIFSCW